MEFIDREEQLGELERLYTRPGGSMVNVFGRRRVGKTSLMREFVKGKPHLFYTADAKAEIDQVKAFTDIMASLFANDAPFGHFMSWPESLEFLLVRLQEQNRRAVVVLDEFPEICAQNKAVPSVLRALWDGSGEDSRTMLVVTGSLVSEMRGLEMGKEPLFGRFHGRIHMRPFTFPESSLFIPDRGIRQRIETYAVLGGMPRYLDIGAGSSSIWKTIENDIFNPNRVLYEEVFYILGQELRDPALYMSILAAISRGLTRPAKIGSETGIKADTVSAYLHRLEKMDIVGRAFPVTEKSPDKSRRVSYFIKDNFVRFWLRYLFPYKYLVESGEGDAALDIVRADFPGFVSFTFEEVVRDAVRAENTRQALPIPLKRTGRYWDKNIEIDICGPGEDKGSYLWGECQWRNEKMGPSVLENLKAKVVTSGFADRGAHYYLLCSRSGFRKSLIERAKAEGVTLWDLGDLDRILRVNTSK
ncbi:MAG: ATP-binding protein [Actinomycetia bacterium]|nr:ATP-binding protein [Actinomycetes bacterium]